MVAQPYAAACPGCRPASGDVERALRDAQPTHAVGKTGRRQSHLRVLEAQTDFTQNSVRRDPASVEVDLGVAAVEPSMVDGADYSYDVEPRSIRRHQEHGRAQPGIGLVGGTRHDDAERGALNAC